MPGTLARWGLGPYLSLLTLYLTVTQFLVLEAAPTNHWAFNPLSAVVPPTPKQATWARSPLDRFILERLERERLHPAPEADRDTWLRRVCLDLTGLPPSPEFLERFKSDRRPNAFEQVVDELLSSPRYGERWAQMWLDVVRYADTHGFEVNTERPNAWPYRDYVIEAFNRDTPYDQFVREQIAGDAFEKDAATGFLVTASVLLPGQIGADDVSKRLARQDALDEMVVNTGQTFLGLSIGCARCHNHKFDPITARDYYSMQAFFAGVEYEERELRTPEARRRREETNRLKARLAALEQGLSRYQPLATPASTPLPLPNSRQNDAAFPPMDARIVRFTIYDANLHPTLGLIEPCLDEFEIFTDGPGAKNVALSSQGTRVTASGSRESGSHRLQHLNDGAYGNGHSWMSDTPGRGWVQFELPAMTRISKIVWGRDREGVFTDRTPTAYTLQAGPSTNELRQVASLLPRRPALNAAVNTDRFAPIKTRRLRFTIKATNSLEPCIDELEVFDTEGNNVALASRGTTVMSSGDTVVANRHELRQINDGLYGNSHSWMSKDAGKGWVLFNFPDEKEIERVVWGRDREGEFNDRLGIQYQIEVETTKDQWRVVADDTDRQRYAPDQKPTRSLPVEMGNLSPSEAKAVEALLAERKDLEAQIAKSSDSQKVFAGIFRAPDKIHVLYRGDPEQPREPVTPAVLSVLGALALDTDAPEQARRLALANWIADKSNPLTARVMVNRLWQGHFGTGLMETSSDYGRNGSRPSHPELLDWLASEFIRSGWSIKAMHRLMVLSSTYRQSTRHDAAAAARDVDDRLLWRYPSRRLESESIRDSMLAVAGNLNLTMGGRGFNLFNNRGGLSGFIPVESYSGEGLRRMVYAHKVRREREAVFGAFDCPDAGQSTARRRESTTPIQALNLFNSTFTLEQSKVFAARVAKEVGADPAAQIRRAYQLALGRSPSSAEIKEARPVVESHGLATLCRALYNSNEFLFIP